MLSLKRYGWLCVLGGEIALILCWLGGYLPLRSDDGLRLHHQLFATFPGVTWGTFSGFILMVAYVFIFSWVFAAYMVWMHNSSLMKSSQNQ